MQPTGASGPLPPTESSSELCFPLLTLELELFLDAVDQHDYSVGRARHAMAQAGDLSSDDTTSSLGDSAYEVLGDSTILTSSEEDHDETTDSLASTDENGHDDVASLDGAQGSDDGTSSIRSEQPESLASNDRAFHFDDEDACGSGMTVVNTQHDNKQPSAFSSLPLLPPHIFSGHDRSSSASTSTIIFDEPQSYGAESVSVSHTICSFDRRTTMEISKHLQLSDPPVHISATLRQTLGKEALVIDEPFRMVYVGSMSAKGEIVSKIASALAVFPLTHPMRQQSTRFNVVPVSSFEGGQAPDVELIDSFGIEMVVDRCSNAKQQTGSDGGPETARLCLNETFWFQSDTEQWHNIANEMWPWKKPHLAVFYISDDDHQTIREIRHNARLFMVYHQIPCVFISQRPLYANAGQIVTVDQHAIHMCLESRSYDNSAIVKRLPIDLGHFLELEERQLNRNLSHLVGMRAGRSRMPVVAAEKQQEPQREAAPAKDLQAEKESAETKGVEHSGSSEGAEAVGSANKNQDLKSREVAKVANDLTATDKIRPARDTGKTSDETASEDFYLLAARKAAAGWKSLVAVVAIFLLCVVAGGAITLAFEESAAGLTPASGWAAFGLGASPAAIFGPAEPFLASIFSGAGEGTTATAMTATGPEELAETFARAGSSAELARFLVEGAFAAPNDSDEVQVHVVGGRHVMLRPPNRFVKCRRDAGLTVKVTRQDEELAAKLSKVFDGLYAVQLEAADAWGALNVSVWTRSGPRLSQTAEVNFGSVWLKAAGWQKVGAALGAELGGGLEVARAEVVRLSRRITVQRARRSQALLAAKARELAAVAAAAWAERLEEMRGYF